MNYLYMTQNHAVGELVYDYILTDKQIPQLLSLPVMEITVLKYKRENFICYYTYYYP